MLVTPLWLQPQSYFDLFRFTGESIQGVNIPWAYVGGMGTRSPMHIDNGGLPAVHWNFGPGIKLWFLIDYKHRAKVCYKREFIQFMTFRAGQHNVA